MFTRGALIFKISMLFVLISLLGAGCEVPGLSDLVPTATPTNDWELFASGGIQSTLNDYNTALANNDKNLYTTTIDQENAVLKEFYASNFDALENSGAVKTIKLGMTVIGADRLDDDLALAHIKRDRDEWRADWFFRRLADKWVISEPTAVEAGAPESLTTDNYTFITYPIADEVNQKIIAIMPKAIAHVREDLGQVPTTKVEVRICANAITFPYGGSGALSGWDITAVAGGADAINIIVPTSWLYGFYDPQVGWEADYEMLLTHELARIAYVRNFGNPGNGADWFFEGLAEYVAGYDEMPEVIAAVQNDTLIPIVDTSSSIKKVDLAHYANVDNWTLAYGLSEALVTFIVEQYDGLETFWNLASAYDKSQDMQTAIQATLGVSYAEFDTAWRTWLKEAYIKRGG